jgi:hypothetical protein
MDRRSGGRAQWPCGARGGPIPGWLAGGRVQEGGHRTGQENSDRRPWRLVEAFWFCRSAIGGSAADDDVGGASVPNYYRAAQFCTDSKLGGCFGALGQPNGWETAFWKDPGGHVHPDTRWKVDAKLRPGDRWTADGVAYLWIFALRDAEGWHDVAGCHRLGEGLLTAGEH